MSQTGTPDAAPQGLPAPRDTATCPPTQRFMSVRQVADYLHCNEKKIYALVSEGKIPGTKVTGKWLFPRDLVDQWLLESSHGGILTDRLILAGSDDPLLRRVIMGLADATQAAALVSYTTTGTKLGLSLLSNHRADVCPIHWGPAAESHLRHPALIRHYPQAHHWVVVRIARREQGLMVARRLTDAAGDARELLKRPLRWVFRQAGAGSQRFLQESAAELGIELDALRVVRRAYSEADAAGWIAMDQADIAPGARSAAAEFGLGFTSVGWEAMDLVLPKGIYFRALFQRLLDELKSADTRELARTLGGYDLSELGKLIWAA